MKLISIKRIPEGCMLPRVWACMILGMKTMGFAFYIPWIFNGPYYEPMNRLQRFGWRIPRVLFEIRLRGRFRVIRKYIGSRSYTDYEVPKLRFNKFFWYEAI